MPLYLKDIPLEDALKRMHEALSAAGLDQPLPPETIALDEFASGRVLAAGVWAGICSPHYHAAAMDGFAVHSSATRNALPSTPLRLETGESAFYVDTGDPLPDGTNAVIPVELVEVQPGPASSGGDPRQAVAILIRASVAPWSHVRLLGEDIVATQLILPAGRVLRPWDIGAVAAGGQARVSVIRKPQVAIIPTGDELVPIGSEIKTGEIIEYNSMMMAAQVNSWGGIAHRYPIVPDDPDRLREAVIHAAARYDLVLLNAGSSAGSEDYSAGIINSLGEVLVHGVAVRPGHPVIIGMLRQPVNGIEKHTPVIGVPGYPVSAVLTCELFVKPLLERWCGPAAVEPDEVEAVLTHKVTSPAGDDDMLRVAVGSVDGRLLAAPLNRGAGVITSLVRADGITTIPRGVQGLAAGEKVKVRLHRPLKQLENTLFFIGSHDITLDVLAEYLAEHGQRLVASNVGSLGGLMALSRAESHACGTHLLDPETGIYNDLYIRKYLPGTETILMGWVGRVQGLLVKPGNPKQVAGLEDLTRPDVTFINRQRGAGTRVLLDYRLKGFNIQPENINGYTSEEYTHLAVAAAVSSGRADCGLGIAAAAQALNLDFIPLFDETYELAVPARFYNSGLFEPVIKAAADPAFLSRVQQLPGYDTSPMGSIRTVA